MLAAVLQLIVNSQEGNKRMKTKVCSWGWHYWKECNLVHSIFVLQEWYVTL